MIIRRLPLYYRVSREPLDEAPGIPTFADFELTMDKHGLVRQVIKPNLEEVLDRVYAAERTVCDVRSNAADNHTYYRPFRNYIRTNWPKPTPPRTGLDMGCGDGFLVSWLNGFVNEAVGVEIAPQSSPWPNAKISRYLDPAWPKFDLIVHHHVLEHVQDPVMWLTWLAGHMHDCGIMMIAVPDCLESISHGDLSLCLHQHVSYFEEASLRLVCQLAGLRAFGFQTHGGSLYFCAEKMGNALATSGSLDAGNTACFEADIARNVGRFRNRWVNACAAGSVGVYVPLRAAPYILAVDMLGLSRCRFFDDGFAGKYLDGFPRWIEGFDDLEKDPPQTVFVMSLTNGDAIASRINQACHQTVVITLREILTL